MLRRNRVNKREHLILRKSTKLSGTWKFQVFSLALYPFLLLEMHFTSNVDSYPMDKKSSLQKSSSFSTGEFRHLASQVTNAGSPFPHPWSSCSSFYSEKLLRFPDKQLTSFAGSFGYVSPEVIKNTGHGNPVDIWWTGIITLRRTTSSFLSLHSVPLCGCPPPVSVTKPQLSLSKSAIPKSSLPYWSSVSDRDQAESFIRRLAALGPLHRRAQEALRDPWSTPTDAPSHIDLSPTLRQNWSLRAKRTVPWLASGPPTGLPHLLLLRAAWACKVVVDGTIWIRIHASSLKCRRKRRMTLVATLCPVLLNLLIQNCCFLGRVGKNLDYFLTLQIWSHFWKLN